LPCGAGRSRSPVSQIVVVAAWGPGFRLYEVSLHIPFMEEFTIPFDS